VTRARLPRVASIGFGLTVLAWAVGAHAAPVQLADTTTVDHWTLGNGLRVVTRSIPRARDVSITVAYRYGMDDDAAGRQGLAQLMGDLAFTAAAGSQPARTPADLDRAYPQGWSDPVTSHLTLLTQVVAKERVLDGLDECALRMKGVRFEAPDLDAAIKRIRRELASQYFGDPVTSLGIQARDMGRGWTDEQMVQRASGAGLAGLTVAEVATAMQQAYVPANAVLSLAGDLRGVDVHAEIERRFAAIPAGVARPETPPTALKPAQRTIHRKGDPIAVVGVIAPALSDSMSPAFYIGALLYVGVAEQTWYPDNKPHTVLYQYPLFDEPELLRLYPLVKPAETDFEPIQKRMLDLGELARGVLVDPASYRDMKNTITWLMGGAMGPDQVASARRNRGALMTLTRAQASCELRGGHAFWEQYRKRLAAVLPGRPENMTAWLTDPAHQIRVLSLPSGN
jgi:hypothetical protein